MILRTYEMFENSDQKTYDPHTGEKNATKKVIVNKSD